MRSMVYQLVDVVVAPREPGEPNEIGDPPGRSAPAGGILLLSSGA